MLETIGIPIISASLFFLAGIIFGNLLSYRNPQKNSPSTSNEQGRFALAKVVLKKRRIQLRQTQDLLTNSCHAQEKLAESLKKNCQQLNAIREQTQSDRNELTQLKLDDLEQKEELKQQIRRNHLLTEQLAEIIEAKESLSQMAHQAMKLPTQKSDSNTNDRLKKHTGEVPIIISDRVKLRIPKKANDEPPANH
ncbi:hypothetical protein OAA27_00985 [bacterium]|nr:hypothetical protein [bacterium]